MGLDYSVSAKIISPSNAVVPNSAVLYACRSFAQHIVVRTHRLSLRPRLPREGDAVLVNGLNYHCCSSPSEFGKESRVLRPPNRVNLWDIQQHTDERMIQTHVPRLRTDITSHLCVCSQIQKCSYPECLVGRPQSPVRALSTIHGEYAVDT